MPGMGTGLNANDPTIVAAFHRALLHGGLVVVAIVLVVVVAWGFLRRVQLRSGIALTDDYREPPARRLLRISFGLIWIFDGILQGQASMPLGMGPQVIEPAAAASPSWVQHLDNAMATIWSYHPTSAPAAAVWIQIGIGLWLLVAPRGDWSRLAGVASVAWGLIVWVFGEAFGGIFAPGLTWLFGAPGAVLFYCFAGALIALPERHWTTPRLGRVILRVMGLFFAGMALLQAWPGRGFWQGQPRPGSGAGTLTSMVQQMAQTPQPHYLSSWVAAFASFDAAHGWGVNLFAVVALALIGGAFLTARPRLVLPAVIAAGVLCLADWVLIEDLGFLGGVGTDPNSMIPMALVFIAGYLALVRPATSAVAAVSADAAKVRTWREWVSARPAYTFRAVAAVGAISTTMVGALPMAVASVEPHAATILSQAVDGSPQAISAPAPRFDLVDQRNQEVSLASLSGKVIAVTFLDPVCTSDCPVIAQEFKAADGLLGHDSRRVAMVAIDANPRYTSPAYLLAFDQQENLSNVSNWLYLTSSLTQLEGVWRSYGVEASAEPAGAMVDHSEIAYVIDGSGRLRYILNTDPGPATEATESSFSVVLADTIKGVLASQ